MLTFEVLFAICTFPYLCIYISIFMVIILMNMSGRHLTIICGDNMSCQHSSICHRSAVSAGAQRERLIWGFWNNHGCLKNETLPGALHHVRGWSEVDGRCAQNVVEVVRMQRSFIQV